MQTRLIFRWTLVASLSASVVILIVVNSDISMTYRPGDKDDLGDIPVDDIPTDSARKSTNSVLWFHHLVPFHPFVDDQPKSVIILTYQRSGSSFFGQMLNSNPSVFYMFEPLDALYSAVYGTSQGWNVPSDITTFRNGSQRLLPKNEISVVASFLRTIYTCDIDSLPVESLAHRYWHMFSVHHNNSANYVRCLRRHNLTTQPCFEHTLLHCGRRFGERTPERLEECNRLLWSDKYRASYFDVDTRQQFELYRQCCADLRRKVSDQLRRR